MPENSDSHKNINLDPLISATVKKHQILKDGSLHSFVQYFKFLTSHI